MQEIQQIATAPVLQDMRKDAIQAVLEVLESRNDGNALSVQEVSAAPQVKITAIQGAFHKKRNYQFSVESKAVFAVVAEKLSESMLKVEALQLKIEDRAGAWVFISCDPFAVPSKTAITCHAVSPSGRGFKWQVANGIGLIDRCSAFVEFARMCGEPLKFEVRDDLRKKTIIAINIGRRRPANAELNGQDLIGAIKGYVQGYANGIKLNAPESWSGAEPYTSIEDLQERINDSREFFDSDVPESFDGLRKLQAEDKSRENKKRRIVQNLIDNGKLSVSKSGLDDVEIGTPFEFLERLEKLNIPEVSPEESLSPLEIEVQNFIQKNEGKTGPFSIDELYEEFGPTFALSPSAFSARLGKMAAFSIVRSKLKGMAAITFTRN